MDVPPDPPPADLQPVNDLLMFYHEVRALAHAHLRGERAGHTLQTTALAHEAFIRIQRRKDKVPGERVLLLAAAGEEMRRVLIDYARARRAQKRGGGRQRMELNATSLAELVECGTWQDVVALDGAFVRLQEVDRRAADVVRLRFFLGLTVDQTAEGLGISRRSVLRDWDFARSFLFAEVSAAHEG